MEKKIKVCYVRVPTPHRKCTANVYIKRSMEGYQEIYGWGKEEKVSKELKSITYTYQLPTRCMNMMYYKLDLIK